MKATGKSARGASLEAGLGEEGIRNIKRGHKPDYSKLPRLASVLNCTVAYLLGRVERPEETDGVEPALSDFAKVPLISYIRAGDWAAVSDPYSPGQAEEWLGLNYKAGKSAFALRIKGKSMEPEFREGDVVIIDPDVAPSPGDCVAAKRDKDDEATFKKYRPRGRDKKGNDIIELTPINPDYPPLHIDAANPGKIIGTMIEHRRFRR